MFSKRSSKTSIESEKFFIDFVHKFKKTSTTTNQKLERVLFISLLGLFECWEKVDPITLQHCILLLPLKKQWIYKKNNSKTNLLYQHNLYNNRGFIKLLQYKDSQNLCIFMKDDNDSSKSINRMSNVWNRISNQLGSLYNPVTCRYIEKLNLKMTHWKNEKVIEELIFGNGNFFATKKIIHDSNGSLRIVASPQDLMEGESSNIKFVPALDNNPDSGLWWISEDYYKQ